MSNLNAVPFTYVRRDNFSPSLPAGGRSLTCDLTGDDNPAGGTQEEDPNLQPVGGSREHFFHFLLGYLLPTVYVQSLTAMRHFQVVDCGPLMTPILTETLNRLGYSFDVINIKDVVNPYYVPAWDRRWPSEQFVAATCERVAAAWGHHSCGGVNCNVSENLILKRSPPHSFYNGGGAEIGGYGTARRCITNLEQVSEALSARGVDHSLYEPGQHCLGCQISAFAHARRILGMRGAEWANVIWSKAGVRARVLDPDPPAHTLTALLERCGVAFEFAVVNSRYIEEDAAEAERFFTT